MSSSLRTVATLALALAATVGHADTLEKVKSSGSFTIGHRDASIPFSYYDDKQKPIGYSVDLCLRIVDAVQKIWAWPSLKSSTSW